jgi:uncharacterized protein (TIGR03118 family)
MKFPRGVVLSVGAALGLFPMPGFAQHYVQKNLVSNLPLPPNSDGSKVLMDPNLKNPWGLTRSAGTPWWVSNNNSGTSSLYDGNGNPIDIFTEADGMTGNFVTVPTFPAAPAGSFANPTGVVFNGVAADFILDKGMPNNLPAIFIFVGEDGIISGWNPGANLPAGVKSLSPNVVRQIDHSDGGSSKGAVYKGATLAIWNAKRYLYVTNFRSGKIEVYDSHFKRVPLDDDAFLPDGDNDSDDHDANPQHIPAGFAPFNIQNIGGSLFVTYAKQNPEKHDQVPGDGLGYVEIYTPGGKHIGHLQHGPWLNAPWGAVWTPRDFGRFSNSILVGNFGSGWIAAFNGFTYKFEGFLQNPDNSLLFIDGLWSLTFGNGGKAGPSTTLFFTAGLNGENDGLFGTLTPVPAENDESVE